MLEIWGNMHLNKESEKAPFKKVRFMEGPEGGELHSYEGEQHFREWNNKCKGHKVGMCWNEQKAARKFSWEYKELGGELLER